MRQENEKPTSWKDNHAVAKLVIALAVVLIVTFLLYQAGFFHFFVSHKRMVRFLDSMGQWSFLAFIALQAFQVIAAPIPGDVTGFLGGYLYGPLLGIIFSTIGLTIGSYVAFALSRAFGKPFVSKFVPRPARDRFNYLLKHSGAFIVFLLFLIPGFPKDYLCYILGLGELSTARFIVIGGAGRLFGTILLTLGGSCFRRHQYWPLGLLVGMALIATLITMAYKDKIEARLRLYHRKSQAKKQSALPHG